MELWRNSSAAALQAEGYRCKSYQFQLIKYNGVYFNGRIVGLGPIDLGSSPSTPINK